MSDVGDVDDGAAIPALVMTKRHARKSILATGIATTKRVWVVIKVYDAKESGGDRQRAKE